MNLAPEVKRIAGLLRETFAERNEIPYLLILYKADKNGKIKASPQDLTLANRMAGAIGRTVTKSDLTKIVAKFGKYLAHEKQNIVATMVTGEAWMGLIEVDKKDKSTIRELINKNGSASKLPNRKEVVMLNARDAEGNEVQEVYEIKTAMSIKDGEMVGTHREFQADPILEVHSTKGKCTYLTKDGKKLTGDLEKERMENPMLEGFWDEFHSAKALIK